MSKIKTDDHCARQKRLVLCEPVAGWSRASFDRELTAYVAERGRAAQTATMHPDTALSLGLSEALVDPALGRHVPLVVTSSDYARQTITLYY